MSERWKVKKRAGTLEARFEFDDYDVMRDFLDDVADVTEKLDHHPNISFSRSHVSIIIYSQEGGELSDLDHQLAHDIEECFNQMSHSS